MKKEERSTEKEYHKTETYTQSDLERTSTEKYITENYDKAWEDDRL